MIEMSCQYPEDVIGKHNYCSNVEADTPQAYWRRAVFVPLVDHLLSVLSTRFNKKAIQGLLLLPPNLTSLTEEKVVELYT